MSDTVINAWHHFPPHDKDSAENHAASLRHTRARLDEADQIAQDIRSSKRISEPDRPRLARNLGRMIEAAKAHNVHDLISQLFAAAFGDAVAESALKKRKRYVRLQGEALPPAQLPGEYHARGAEFLRLSQAWADLQRPSDVAPEDARRQAILNLIEGTTFDTRTRITLRRAEASRIEFVEQMNRVLTHISSSVDLDTYFDTASEIPLVPENDGTERKFLVGLGTFWDGTGWDELRIQPIASYIPQSPVGEDGDRLSDGICTHWLAPKVHIGFIYTPVIMDYAIPYTIPQGRKSREHEDELVSHLIHRYGPENVPLYEHVVEQFREEFSARREAAFRREAGMPDIDALAQTMLHNHLQADYGLGRRTVPDLNSPSYILTIKEALKPMYGPDVARMVSKGAVRNTKREAAWISWHSSYRGDKPMVWRVSAVWLAVYRERATGRVRLVITATEDDLDLTYSSLVYRRNTYAGDEHTPVRGLGPDLYAAQEPDVDPLSFRDEVNGVVMYDKNGDLTGDYHDYENKLNFIPGATAISLAFTPLNHATNGSPGIEFKPLFDDCPGSFSPAPHNTIAGAILRNLAHAAPGERLDDLLIADAKHKADVMQRLLGKQESDYRRGIER
ncbi:hypothetical protein [Microvirga aerophila]|uniref:Uncharacterized protein n=1 Tax=Microvirga aerophila TaxID=670291 RepID=A0A512C3G6_9HYPH|nr:hypothetical protein [Microvirga aerophila]GEO18741.1 hypothetical protein MAE02_64370 [Microvirga aerophila]